MLLTLKQYKILLDFTYKSFLRLSNFKSKKLLNWHPKWSLEKSMNKILDWNRDIKFKNPRKVCTNQIKDFLES